MADRFVLSLINRRQVGPGDFVKKESGAVILTDEGRKNVLNAWQLRKQDIITHPFLSEKIQWGLVPHAQALLLSRYIRGDLDLSLIHISGLPNLLLLIGLLHDSGKATKIFNDYLRSGDPSLRGKINHSACGARWIVENLLGDKKEQPAWLAANMAVIAIISHHSGLSDLTSLNEEEVLQSRYYPKKETYYEEAADSFLRECASRKELADLFKRCV